MALRFSGCFDRGVIFSPGISKTTQAPFPVMLSSANPVLQDRVKRGRLQ
jgi:hypothetical protein